MADDLDAVMTRQREFLTKKRNDVQAKITELQRESAEVDRQFAAVLAYEQTLAGKLPVPAAPKSRQPAKRAGRGQKQAEVLRMLEQQPGGMTRGELINALDFKGNKAGAQSVSNALTALKKASKIASMDGKWQVAVQGTAKKAGKRRKAVKARR
jgi:type II secretory pathway component HofQ